MNDNSIIPEGVHIDQLEEIGKGSTATVYRLDEQRVLKVYDRPRYRNRPDFVEREAAVSHATALAGLPVPDSHGVGTVDGFLCAVYDLIKGDSLGDVILEDPSTIKAWAGRMAQLAKQIHSLDATDEVFTPVRMITKLYPYIEPNIDGESMQRFKVLAEAVSGGDKMVHTDFHFDNVLVDDGELRLIDAGGMSCGHPVYDLLSMYRRAYFPKETRSKLTPEQNRQFYECFLDAYFGDRLTAYARELLDDVTAFLTRCIRIGVPFAEGRGDRNAFKELLTTDPGTMRGRFSELDSLIFS